MSAFELVHFPDAQALARTVARLWLQEMAGVSSTDTAFRVALSGGRIAGHFLAAAADLARSNGAGFAGALTRAHFFWGDERCVPPEDPESNFARARKTFLLPLAIPENQIHRIRGEDPPEVAAAAAAAELCRLAPVDRTGQPILDLVLLGMGEDGHVASLFPAEPEEMVCNRVVFRPVTAVKPPPRRITIGYPALAAARQVWVLASGPGKEPALRESLAPAGRTPLARLLKLCSRTRIFTDLPTGA